MKRYRLFLTVASAWALCLLTVACQGDATREAISRQLEQYPASRVQDIYKSFCQDNLGPGHLIPDTAQARAYLMSELKVYREDLSVGRYRKPQLRYMPVGDQGNYVRVDLSVVLDGLVDAETLLDAFVRSANEGKVISRDAWQQKWSEVEAVIREDFPEIPGASGDLAAIDSLVSSGQLILHHSELFNETYHPHYRIVDRRIFDKELKDKITKSTPGTMREIQPTEIKENPISLFDETWALVTAGVPGKLNTMTISWGSLGELWNKPVVTVYVSSSRYTHEFMERNGRFTVAFFPERYRQALNYLGTHSGRDSDKIAASGLTLEFLDSGQPSFAEARMVIEARKIYGAPFSTEGMGDVPAQFYASRNLGVHSVYVGEIEHVWVRE